MKTNILNLFAVLLVVIAMGVAGCSDDPTSPVTNSTNNNPTVARPRISYENGALPPVPILGLQCLGGATGAVCSVDGFLAVLQNNAWQALDTGQSVTLLDVWGTSVNDLYVVGTAGCALHWNGTSFTELHLGVGADFVDVWGTASNDVWMVSGGTIAHWDGSSATLYDGSTLPINGTFTAVGGSSSSDVWIVANSGHVLHWDGASWSLVTTGLGSTHLESVFVAGVNVFIGGRDGILWRFDGTTWTSTTVPGATSTDKFDVMTGTGPNRVYALGQDGMMFGWDGTAWSDISDPFFGIDYDVLAACAVGPTIVVGGYYRSGPSNLALYDGSSWSVVAPHPAGDADLNAAWTFDADDAYAFGAFGAVLHRDATEWSAVSHGLTTHRLLAAWASGPSDLYAVGDAGTVLHYDGNSWSLVNTGLGTAYLVDVYGSGPNDVWCIGDTELWHWDGTTWTDRSNELPGTVSNLYAAIWVSNDGDVFAGGDVLAHYDGSAWTSVPVKAGSSGGFIQSMYGTSATNVWMSDYSGVLHWNGSDLELRWPNISGEVFSFAGRDGNLLAAQAGMLLQFASIAPTIIPLPALNALHDVHTGSDGVTYVVGDRGYIARIE